MKRSLWIVMVQLSRPVHMHCMMCSCFVHLYGCFYEHFTAADTLCSSGTPMNRRLFVSPFFPLSFPEFLLKQKRFHLEALMWATAIVLSSYCLLLLFQEFSSLHENYLSNSLLFHSCIVIYYQVFNVVLAAVMNPY